MRFLIVFFDRDGCLPLLLVSFLTHKKTPTNKNISTIIPTFIKLIFYVISALSCVFYTPNRKALKELIAAWPNIEDLIKGRSMWRKGK